MVISSFYTRASNVIRSIKFEGSQVFFAQLDFARNISEVSFRKMSGSGAGISGKLFCSTTWRNNADSFPLRKDLKAEFFQLLLYSLAEHEEILFGNFLNKFRFLVLNFLKFSATLPKERKKKQNVQTNRKTDFPPIFCSSNLACS